MAERDKVLINLATGMEEIERVLVALLVATAAQQQDKEVVIWATKDAVRLGLPGGCRASSARTAPRSSGSGSSTPRPAASSGLCPICLASRDLAEAEKVEATQVVGATPMWEWVGSDATVFSYFGRARGSRVVARW